MSGIREIAIETIQFGERRREDYGDVAALAAHIQAYGLLHPVTLTMIAGNVVVLAISFAHL